MVIVLVSEEHRLKIVFGPLLGVELRVVVSFLGYRGCRVRVRREILIVVVFLFVLAGRVN